MRAEYASLIRLVVFPIQNSCGVPTTSFWCCGVLVVEIGAPETTRKVGSGGTAPCLRRMKEVRGR
jgi:hypothetical protein